MIDENSRVRSLACILRSGRGVIAFRSDIELFSGPWTSCQDLVEDGRATALFLLPDGGSLLLTGKGELLIVHTTEDPNVYRCSLIQAGVGLWKGLTDRYPGIRPGRCGFRRYWVLRERRESLDLFGLLDILRGDVVGWDTSRSRAEAEIESLNQSH